MGNSKLSLGMEKNTKVLVYLPAFHPDMVVNSGLSKAVFRLGNFFPGSDWHLCDLIAVFFDKQLII